jgi:tetratricopeptide (TPR) repeat protein
MAKENENKPSFNPAMGPTPQERAKAIKWFEHGKIVADTHNYDYAIECFINGLTVWPEAVEEGHKPLRAVGFMRLGTGKKKPGMLDRFRFSRSSGTSRDPLQGMLTAEKLLAQDPTNLNYMEVVLKNAAKAGYQQTCMWLGPILLEEAAADPKTHEPKLVTAYEVLDELGDKYAAIGNIPQAVKCFELALRAMDILAKLKPNDSQTQDLWRNMAGKLTIVKGKFETGDFRESLHDSQKQRDLIDQERMVQDDSRYEELIQSSLKALEASPNEAGKVFAVTAIMLRRGHPKDEEAAIKLLLDAYTRTKAYIFKMRADDVRIAQLYRQARELKAKADRKAAAEHIEKLIEFEISVYHERVQQYPIDARYKYELGKRYFLARRYDEAVPILQLARNDPKHRMQCLSLIAQCFHLKGYQDQAIHVLLDGIRDYEFPGDDISKELHYWLGRAYEAAGQKEEAIQTYGRIIQWDYNYRNGDVRQRLEIAQQDRKSGTDQ